MNEPRALQVFLEKYGVDLRDSGAETEEVAGEMLAVLEGFGLDEESADDTQVPQTDG